MLRLRRRFSDMPCNYGRAHGNPQAPNSLGSIIRATTRLELEIQQLKKKNNMMRFRMETLRIETLTLIKMSFFLS